MESLHTFGLSLLVFRVLPRLDVVHGLLLLTAVGTLPSILKPVTGVEVECRGSYRALRCFFNRFLDLLAMAGQLSALPVIYLLDYVKTDGADLPAVLDVAGAVLLVSVSCWENFMDGRFFVQLGDHNVLKNFMLKVSLQGGFVFLFVYLLIYVL